MGQILDQIFGQNFFYKIWLKFWDQNSGQNFRLNFGLHYLARLCLILALDFFTNLNEFLDQILCHNFGPQLNKNFRQNLVHSEKSS